MGNHCCSLPRTTMTSHNMISVNDVNRNSRKRGSSSGRGIDVRQVSPDRNQATVRLKNNTIKIATWNVRSLYRTGKLDNVRNEMKRMKVNVMGLCDVRWVGAGVMKIEDDTLIHSGGEKHERGVGVLIDKSIGKSLK